MDKWETYNTLMSTMSKLVRQRDNAMTGLNIMQEIILEKDNAIADIETQIKEMM